MKSYLLHIVLFFCFTQLYSQEDGIVAFALPVRNSLKFNSYAINPTFSFVREQNKYITFTNKREWIQFDDAPQTYLFSYSGRFKENTGMGVGLFQQNYGILTTFGGVLNYAYNAVLNQENNLTFGVNLGVYKSGINDGKVITNFPDASLDNMPSNTILTINPGINYGTAFFDFGLSLNNLVSYNLKSSKLIEDNPEQTVQGHIMYTGYLNSRGFFDESKFSTLIRSEFKKDNTIISGIAMLTVPKGIWAQAGYNTLYGLSAGIGINISTQIALEYNYEKAMGDLSTFGNSHEITLAYKFKNRYRYDYSGDDEESAFIIPEKKQKRVVVKRKTTTETKVDRIAIAEAKEKARIEAAEQVKAKADERAALAEEAKVKKEAKADEAARLKLAQEVAAKAKAEEEARIQLAQEVQAKSLVEAKAKSDEAARLKFAQEADEKAKADEVARLKLAQEAQAEAEVQAKLLVETKAKADEAARVKLAQEVAAKAKAEEEARIQLAQEAQAKSLVEAKAKSDEAARLKLAQEVQAEAEVQAKLLVETKAKADEAARVKLAQEVAAKAKAEEEARIKLAQEAQAKAEAEAQAKLAEAARIKAEEEARAKAEEAAELASIPTDATAKSMNVLAKSTEASGKEQQDLLTELVEKVAVKQQDLDDLKEENDLSEQGIYKAPKAFKSVSAENAALESLKSEIDVAIKSQDLKISELEKLYNERLKEVPNRNDSVNASYLKTIQELKSEQLKAIQSKANLVSTLESIKVATEIERKRRIKRAAYDNEQDRYLKDRAVLKQIQQFTPESTVPLRVEDFDFGEEQTKNIQIVKDVENVESGYYLVLAVHSDVAKRDDFLTKAVSLGQANINFFYDVNTSKYYIYYEKFDAIETAEKALQAKGNAPYNSKMSMFKIEN